ncbi:MAG: TolC family protein [Spirochaetes bacterium]|nr:TolC family protein [Spirochaetota bacterium]MBN2769270.1 TolC family protein [Spirochaetota bacterium]
MKKLVALSLFFVFTINLYPSSELDYETYLGFVKNNLPELIKTRINEEIARREVQKASGINDTKINSSLYYYKNDPTQVQQSQGVENTTGLTGEAEVSKKILPSGTELFGGAALSRSVVDRDPQQTAYQPSLTLGVRQPLLYNFLGSVDRFSEQNARLGYEIERIQTKITEKSLLNSYALLYHQWIIYSRIAEINRKGVVNARTVYNQMLRKKRSGLAENDEVQKSYSSLLSFRQKHEQSLIDEMQVREKIAVLTGLDYIKPESSQFDRQYSLVKKFSFDLRNFDTTTSSKYIDLLAERMKLSRETAENKLMPQVDAVASVTKWDENDTLSDSVSYGKTDYKIGIELSHSFGNNSAEAEYEISKLEIAKIQEDMRSAINSFNTEIRQMRDESERIKTIIIYKERNIRSLRSQLATETQKYQSARIDLAYLINTRNSIAAEESSLLLQKYNLISLYYAYSELVE